MNVKPYLPKLFSGFLVGKKTTCLRVHDPLKTCSRALRISTSAVPTSRSRWESQAAEKCCGMCTHRIHGIGIFTYSCTTKFNILTILWILWGIDPFSWCHQNWRFSGILASILMFQTQTPSASKHFDEAQLTNHEPQVLGTISRQLLNKNTVESLLLKSIFQRLLTQKKRPRHSCNIGHSAARHVEAMMKRINPKAWGVTVNVEVWRG